MKLLLDENLPKRLKTDLAPHAVFTVRDMGWNGKGNGELLALMEATGFEVLLTFDKNLQYQQNFRAYSIPVLVLDAVDNSYVVLSPLMPVVHSLLLKPIAAGPLIVRA
jgi:predicted nuclease of predicted toxin-antitoxin system